MSHVLFQSIAGKEEEILDFIMQTREVRAYPFASYAIRLSCEEIIVNIIRYAYPEQTDGYIGVGITDLDGELRIVIWDGGRAFNPLEKELPDTSFILEARDIGGLGILLMKQMMDKVSYIYADGENRLLMIKNVGK